MRMSQYSTVAVVAVALAALAGCAPSEPASRPTASPTASSSTSPSASPSSAPAAAVGPERLFGGDCTKLFAVDELKAAIGVAVTPQSTEWDLDPEYVAPAQLGGLGCHWSESPATDSVGVSAVVLPESALVEPRDIEPECTEGYGCTFTATSNGFTLSGVLHNPSAAIAQTTAAYEALVARFAAKVATEAQPERYVVAGAWSADTECVSLDAQRLVGAAIGQPGLEPNDAGGDAEPNYGYYRAAEAAGLRPCGWSSDGSASVQLQVLPGGAWVEDDVAAQAGAKPVAVAGATAAYVVGDRLHVFAGPNWLVLKIEPSGPLDPLYPAAAELVAELDTAL
jgi:hypothetical protein